MFGTAQRCVLTTFRPVILVMLHLCAFIVSIPVYLILGRNFQHKFFIVFKVHEFINEPLLWTEGYSDQTALCGLKCVRDFNVA